MKKSDFIYFLSKYLNHYLPQQTGASKNTLKAYNDTFKLLFLFAKEKHRLKPSKIQLETINRKFVLAFLGWVTKQRKCSNTTRNLRLNNIKAFFSYVQTQIPALSLHSQDILQIPKKKTEQKVIDYITLDGIKLILSLPDKQTHIGRKHLVLLSFMFAAGARVGEVIDVTINDFKYNGSESVKIVGKGNKARMVPLEKEMIELLEGYLQEEKSKRVFYNIDDPIFLNRSNAKFTRQGIGYIVKKYAAGIRLQSTDVNQFNYSSRYNRPIKYNIRCPGRQSPHAMPSFAQCNTRSFHLYAVQPGPPTLSGANGATR